MMNILVLIIACEQFAMEQIEGRGQGEKASEF